MAIRHLEIEDIKRLAETTAVELDGEPARICGFASDFATVITLDGTRQVEFSWPAVGRIIISTGWGRFTS